MTVADTLAPSHLPFTSQTAGKAAEILAERKEVKYSNLTASYLFVPLAFETMGAIHDKTLSFLLELGKRLTLTSGDRRESSFLLQRLYIALQRLTAFASKAVLLQPSLLKDNQSRRLTF